MRRGESESEDDGLLLYYGRQASIRCRGGRMSGHDDHFKRARLGRDKMNSVGTTLGFSGQATNNSCIGQQFCPIFLGKI